MKKKKKIHPLVSGSGRRLSWQTDDFKRQATFSFTIPYQFLLLCRLLDTTPAELLTDFMDNLSCGSWKREGRDKAKQKLIEYFIEHGYGQKRYTTTDIISIFREMDAIGMLYPKNAAPEILNQHIAWRDNYHQYWFEKWYYKFNRT